MINMYALSCKLQFFIETRLSVSNIYANATIINSLLSKKSLKKV